MSYIEDRVNNVFEKLNHIQSNVENTKKKKIQQIYQAIEQQTQMYIQSQKQKHDYQEQYADKITQLQHEISIIKQQKDNSEQQFQDQLIQLKQNCLQQIQNYGKERKDIELTLQTSMQKQSQTLQNELLDFQDLEQFENFCNKVQNFDLPQVSEMLRTEDENRKQIEQRIYQQFSEQLHDLKEVYELEKREREAKEEQIVEILKNIYTNIQSLVKQNQKDREKNEQMMVNLCEKIIEKIKNDFIEEDNM